MDFDLLVSSLSETKDPTEDELIVQGLPQLCIPCATIKISSKHVLKKAAKMLGVLIHGYEFTSLDTDEVTAKVIMDVPPHKGNPPTIRREFYGEWTRFGSEAKESACLAALTYLKNEGLIAVHDTNYVELNNFKRKYEAEHFWSSALYARAFALQEQLSTMSGTVVTTKQGKARIPYISTESDQSTPPSSTTEASTSLERTKEKTPPRRALRKELFP